MSEIYFGPIKKHNLPLKLQGYQNSKFSKKKIPQLKNFKNTHGVVEISAHLKIIRNRRLSTKNLVSTHARIFLPLLGRI